MPTLKVNEIVSYSGNTLTIGASTDTLSYVGAIVKADTIQNASASNLVVQTNTTTITIGRTGQTISIPSGATLSNSGTLSGFGLTLSAVKTSGFTAVAGNLYPCNTTSAAFTVTLPASATAGDQIGIVDYAGTFATNNLILGRNGLNIEGGTGNKSLTTNREAVTITYVDSTQGWVASSGVNSGSQALDPITYSIDFLVVAGGGSATGHVGGGGGAGGYRISTQTVSGGTVITVTVGDGGSGGSGSSNNGGNSGSNSSISGSGLTTITSAGGGIGKGSAVASGGSGGSGGGGGGYASPAGSGGSGNTPSTSPSQGNNGGSGLTGNPNGGGGGGGGAGAVGSNAVTSQAGAGGNGTASSITGSSVTYAGGGGGGGANGTTAGSGGSGGGGAGAAGVPNTQIAGTNGTANLGGGAGGGSDYNITPVTEASGGKGVVILSMATSNYTGTTTGSPTVTTSGSNTILKFTGSGSYTA